MILLKGNKISAWNFHLDISKGISIVLVSMILFASSCAPVKNIAYFQDLDDTSAIRSQSIAVAASAPKIEPDDILIIQVSSPIKGAADMYNQSSGNASVSNTSDFYGASSTVDNLYQRASDRTLGYLVDADGNIKFPVLGRMKVSGLTLTEAGNMIEKKLDTFLTKPLVDVRFLNYKITVLGEVNKPGTYVIPNQRINVLEALGMAGDMTIFGRRENLLVVREKNGIRSFGRINMNSSESLFKSPFYNLQQGDIVYVEPHKNKARNSDVATIQRTSIALAILNTISIMFRTF